MIKDNTKLKSALWAFWSIGMVWWCVGMWFDKPTVALWGSAFSLVMAIFNLVIPTYEA